MGGSGRGERHRGRARPWLAVALAFQLGGPSAPARADFPYPTCSAKACADPADFGAYLFLAPGELPDDLDPMAGGSWKYLPDTGVDVTGAWSVTTGRPDVVAAILDSGIRWDAGQVARALWLNAAELPVADGCAAADCNGDGFVSVDDYAATPDHNGNGLLDGQDLLIEYSNGIDEDGNGFVDDIAGWDFVDDDNDAHDDTDYGHGTGEAGDQVAEANDGVGAPGYAPSSRFVPLRVADSFVAVGSDFARAVVYATDLGADLVSEALGALSASESSQAAIDYAYRRGVPVIASAADEESRHHNLPAALDHTLWVNSIVHEDGTFVENEGHDYLNGCTNYGGHAWVAIPSNACSSEATGRAAGMVSLLVAHGRNLMDAGALAPYPGSDRPFSAEEIRQLLRAAAEDVSYGPGERALDMFVLVSAVLSAPALGLSFGSERFPTQPGWDQFTGYGRPHMPSALGLVPGSIPPEADLSGNVAWWDSFDPVRDRRVRVRGSVGAVRAGSFHWTLEEGCGVQPDGWKRVGRGRGKGFLSDVVLGKWKPKRAARRCGFDPAEAPADPDAHTVTLRLVVEDDRGLVGEDRRTVAVHRDESLAHPPIALGSSAESAGVLVDLDGDGVLDIVHATSDGRVHARRGATGSQLPGFPVRSDALPLHASPGWSSGEVPPPHETILGALAAGDLDGDGSMEIVGAGTEGRIYVWDAHGARRAGFPVSSDPALSNPAQRDALNDTDPGFIAAPTLADLDDDGVLHVVAAGLDGHLYAWDPSGAPRPGFPVRIADPSRVSVDPATGRATPLAGTDAKERAAKLISSPALGDFDGDGRPELVLGSNEEYGGEPDGFAAETDLVEALLDLGDQLGGGFELEVQGRVYAVHPDGNDAAGGPFLPGWPARVPMVVSQLLPTVATGTPGAPALAEIDGAGTLAVAIFGSVGPAILLGTDGAPLLGTQEGVPRALAPDFPNGFPDVPAGAGSADAPFFAALGAGAFGDLSGDGLPEFVAPTGGVRKLLDAAAPANQRFGDHQVTAWDPLTGAVLPAFPRVMEDMQFLTSPSVANAGGSGPAILQGSGAYLLHAYGVDGSEPPGWPKFTHGWLISSPLAGDVDGDGLLEVVAATREGRLYVWDTPAADAPGAVQWQGFARDRHNSGNWSSAVPLAAGPPDPVRALRHWLEGIAAELAGGGAGVPPGVAEALAALQADQLAAAAAVLPELQVALLADPAAAGQPARVSEGLAVAARAVARLVDCGSDAPCQRAARRLGRAIEKVEGPKGSERPGKLRRLARRLEGLLPYL